MKWAQANELKIIIDKLNDYVKNNIKIEYKKNSYISKYINNINNINNDGTKYMTDLLKQRYEKIESINSKTLESLYKLNQYDEIIIK